MSAARDLPSINRSRLFILPSVGSLRQLRVPCWRRDMSNRFSALASYAGAIVTRELCWRCLSAFLITVRQERPGALHPNAWRKHRCILR